MKVITGKESYGNDSRYNILIDFYAAFNTRDIDAVLTNWDSHESICMSNPLGGIKRGREEVQSVYSRLFNGSARVYVEFYDFELIDIGNGFVAIGRERGWFEHGEIRIELAIRTTRVFRITGTSWKQIHHHGSIESPELLDKYQKAVLNQATISNHMKALT